MRIILKVITVSLTLLALGCSQQSPLDAAKEAALNYVKNPQYEMLSDYDKTYITQDIFDEYVEHTPYQRRLLSPTHENFLVERLLRDLVSVEVSGYDENEDGYAIAISAKYPVLLGELWFYFENEGLGRVSKYDREKVENLKNLMESGSLSDNDFEFDVKEDVLTVVDSGVLLDIKDWIERILFIKYATAEIRENAFFKDGLDGVRADYYPRESFQSEFSPVENLDYTKQMLNYANEVLDFIREDYPDISKYGDDLYDIYSFIEKAETVVNKHKISDEMEKCLHFSNVRMAESTRRERGVFFDYRNSCNTAISRVFYTIHFYDDSGHLISSNSELPTLRDIKPNSSDSQGWRLSSNAEKNANSARLQINFVEK